jgi:hypothetical protein
MALDWCPKLLELLGFQLFYQTGFWQGSMVCITSFPALPVDENTIQLIRRDNSSGKQASAWDLWGCVGKSRSCTYLAQRFPAASVP